MNAIEEEARCVVDLFCRRWGQPHLDMAMHAAFLLALSPELLYRLWATFKRDVAGHPINVPWISVADLLLSPLCSEVGRELYEMRPPIQRELLSRLKSDLRFGAKRFAELTTFVVSYYNDQLRSHRNGVREFAEDQWWFARTIAVAYFAPHAAADELKAEAVRGDTGRMRVAGIAHRLPSDVSIAAEIALQHAEIASSLGWDRSPPGSVSHSASAPVSDRLTHTTRPPNSNFINRMAEQELFRELVKAETPARIMTLASEAGTGKTALLMRFRENCHWEFRPPVLVSLISLQQTPSTRPFDLVRRIREDLDMRVFPTFDKAIEAYIFRNWEELGAVLSPVPAAGMDAPTASTVEIRRTGRGRGMRLSEAGRTSRDAFPFNHQIHLSGTPKWTPDMDALAQEACIHSFFMDLKAFCQTSPVVLMFDDFSSPAVDGQGWVLNGMIRERLVNGQGLFQFGRLVVVLAGRSIPAILPDHSENPLIAGVESLSRFSRRDLELLLEIHGYEQPSPTDIDWLIQRLEKGWSLSRILSVVHALAAKE